MPMNIMRGSELHDEKTTSVYIEHLIDTFPSPGCINKEIPFNSVGVYSGELK